MSAGGVELAFVFGLRATRSGVITPNEYVQNFCAETETPTIGFMALDHADADVLDQLGDGIARGLRGVKLYSVLAQTESNNGEFGRAAGVNFAEGYSRMNNETHTLLPVTPAAAAADPLTRHLTYSQIDLRASYPVDR
jgi:hypothetical protein